MDKQINNRYVCKYCGQMVEKDQRAEHIRKHRYVGPNKIHIFEELYFTKVIDIPQAKILSIPTKKTSSTTRPKVSPKTPGAEKYKPVDILDKPKSKEARDLFEYAVKRIAHKYQTDAEMLLPKTHKEWVNYCFDPRHMQTLVREEFMSRIKATYAVYFKKGAGQKYTFDIESILRDYPHFFASGIGEKPINSGLDGMIEAMKIEINLSRQPDKQEHYKVTEIETIDENKRLYGLKLDLDDGETVSFNDSMRVALKIKDDRYSCDCIDFNDDESILYVVSNRLIFGHKGMIYVNTSFILEKICGRLQDVKTKGLVPSQPINKFINGSSASLSEVAPPIVGLYEDIIGKMDSSQKDAIYSTIRHDISFIWGPPGTGKSYTLAGLINILTQRKESTLVCCISNVAVDQLLNKVIDKIEELNYQPYNCEFMRAGYTTDSRILSTDYLFQKDAKSEKLRKKIREINERISSLSKKSRTKAQIEEDLLLKEERIKLSDELKKHTESIIAKSSIVFSTMAYYVLSSQLENKRFDNLIVDEASMLSMPYLTALSCMVFKRIILVGDPNQLGPISLSPEYMLSKSVFDRCNVLDETNPHPALSRLLVQRRSHRFIVNLTNDFFYGGKLKAAIDDSPEWVADDPFPKMVIKVLNRDIKDDAVSMMGTSRRNFGTHAAVMDVLNDCYEAFLNNGDEYTIGVITPFRAQVQMYRAAIRRRFNDDGFWESIKVGTVHTFQGSECDLIIFDLVEKDPVKVSKLFNEKEGERLVNVALSRARHKLIIVGDTKRFLGSVGLATVSPTTCRVLGRLSDVWTLQNDK